MTDEPESLVLQLLREMRGEMSRMNARIDTLATTEGVASALASVHYDLSERIAGLRRDVVLTHNAVIGHGALIEEFEARLLRVEQHLKLPPRDTH